MKGKRRNKPTKWINKWSINQSIHLSINQSISEWMNEWMNEISQAAKDALQRSSRYMTEKKGKQTENRQKAEEKVWLIFSLIPSSSSCLLLSSFYFSFFLFFLRLFVLGNSPTDHRSHRDSGLWQLWTSLSDVLHRHSDFSDHRSVRGSLEPPAHRSLCGREESFVRCCRERWHRKDRSWRLCPAPSGDDDPKPKYGALWRSKSKTAGREKKEKGREEKRGREEEKRGGGRGHRCEESGKRKGNDKDTKKKNDRRKWEKGKEKKVSIIRTKRYHR